MVVKATPHANLVVARETLAMVRIDSIEKLFGFFSHQLLKMLVFNKLSLAILGHVPI
jgi:hypothetical protein